MTPFELSLSHELDIEHRRFDNEWLFQWYNILSENRIVNVPNFEGGRIAIGGVLYEGTGHVLFWQALGRYLNGKVYETFQRWDRETGIYPAALRRSSLDGTGKLITQFVKGVMDRARTTDQTLRGRPMETRFEGSGVHSMANLEIWRLAHAHMELLPAEVADVERSRWRRLLDALHLKPSFMGMGIDLKELFARRK
jgi:hypothetical protein